MEYPEAVGPACYLALRSGQRLSGMSDVDPQLVRQLEALWRNGPAREKDNFIDGIARYVSKSASLVVSDTELRALREFFTVGDMVYLYEHIRDVGRRLEFEWRDEFLRYFPAARNALPPMEVTEEEYAQWEKQNPPTEFTLDNDDIPM
jgi:hypothetical protein